MLSGALQSGQVEGADDNCEVACLEKCSPTWNITLGVLKKSNK